MSKIPTRDRDYYATHAAAERYMAENAPDPVIAAVHRELADHYDARLRAMENLSEDISSATISPSDSSKEGDQL